MDKLISSILFFGTALLPVYTFTSGGLQPTHMVLSVFASLTLLRFGIPSVAWSVFLFGLFLHSFAVEATYSMISGNYKYLINSVFFLYNYILTGAVFLYIREKGLSTLPQGILIATVILLITIITSGVDLSNLNGGGRPTGSFNNPNQLGFFSVCLLSLCYLFYREGRISYWFAAGLFLVALFLAISSLSKAAIIANMVVMLLALKPVLSRNALFGWSIATLVGVIWLARLYANGAFDHLLFVERLLYMFEENDSSLESRGYFAFLEGNISQILFGLGTHRVNDIIGHEVHSTLASVLNNYGFVGFTLFSSALSVWAFRLWQAYGMIGLFCLMAPSLLYGITHNGTRFAAFWILFAASLAMSERRRVPKITKPLS